MKKLINMGKYREFLSTIKQRIQTTRLATYRAANQELITLYYWIGQQIVEIQEQYGWGEAIVGKLSVDLQKGLSIVTTITYFEKSEYTCII